MNWGRFELGNICHALNEAPEPDVRAFYRRFADSIIDAIVAGTRLGGKGGR